VTPEEEAKAWWKAHRGAVPKLVQPGEVIRKGVTPRPQVRKPVPEHDCAITKAISLSSQQADEAVAYFAKSRTVFLKFPCDTCGGFHVVRSPKQPKYTGPRPRKPRRP
jgi:hypothetical protein